MPESFAELLELVRAFEKIHSWVPKLDEATLPARIEGEGEPSWTCRKIDAVLAHVKKQEAFVADVKARHRVGLASRKNEGGVAS
jgi:hypothetical protein